MEYIHEYQQHDAHVVMWSAWHKYGSTVRHTPTKAAPCYTDYSKLQAPKRTVEVAVEPEHKPQRCRAWIDPRRQPRTGNLAKKVDRKIVAAFGEGKGKPVSTHERLSKMPQAGLVTKNNRQQLVQPETMRSNPVRPIYEDKGSNSKAFYNTANKLPGIKLGKDD